MDQAGQVRFPSAKKKHASRTVSWLVIRKRLPTQRKVTAFFRTKLLLGASPPESGNLGRHTAYTDVYGKTHALGLEKSGLPHPP